MVKSTSYFSRGPRFNSQHTYSSSKPSMTLVLRDLTSSSGYFRYKVHTWYTDMEAGKTLIHKNFFKYVYFDKNLNMNV